MTIRRALLPEGGVLQVASDTVFQPAAHGMGNDSRILSCLCDACRIVTPLDALELLEDGS